MSRSSSPWLRVASMSAPAPLRRPASWTPVPVNPGGADRNMEVKLYSFDEPEVPIYSAIWEQRRDMRSLVFLVPGQNPRLGPVALKMIPEIRSVAAAETGALPPDP